MKHLKLSNRNFLKFFLILFSIYFQNVYSNEPIDIWNLEKEKINVYSNPDDKNVNQESGLYEKIIKKKNETKILNDDEIDKNILLAGLFDPQENNLVIDMWSNSDGQKIKTILNKINKIKLSEDADDIYEIALLTNSYFPKKNIEHEEFLKFKIDYLIKKNNLELIYQFIINNPEIKNSILLKHFVNSKLSFLDIKSACEIFDEVSDINDDYLSKFKIYCLINSEKREEAQLLFDLKKELGMEDNFFEEKFNLIMGYEIEDNKLFSEKNILDFHLSHITNPDFKYQPNDKTKKIIWKYLSSSNLLDNAESINLEDIEKIKIIEKATNENNYSEDELFNLYKRFQFNINQLINAEEEYKLLPSYEGRALLYQKLLLSKDINEIMELSLKIKNSFLSENLENSFKEKLSEILKEIKFEDVSSNYTTFYKKNINSKIKKEKIKINNKFVHQSKLLKYFTHETSLNKVEKETNDLLKKIKKNKKYFFTTKDIILIESLKSDGVVISKKYKNLYDVNSNIPVDIQVMINNKELGMTLLRIVEIIGEDELKTLGSETLNFIIDVLNQLDMDKIRNSILLEVLPLKV